MLHEEIAKFEKLTGFNANDFSMAFHGGFWLGYETGKAEAKPANAEHDALQYSKGYQAGFLEAKKLHGETEGEWLDNVFIGGYVCNNCNAGYSSNPKSAFCPICGAKMKNGQVPEVLARRKQSETNGGQPHE